MLDRQSEFWLHCVRQSPKWQIPLPSSMKAQSSSLMHSVGVIKCFMFLNIIQFIYSVEVQIQVQNAYSH